MATWKWQWPITRVTAKPQDVTAEVKRRPAEGKTDEYRLTFDNRNITYNGNVTELNYETILRDKQHHIGDLYELSDYYVDKDPIYRGIIKGVYTPFAICDWILVGADDQVRAKYETYYARAHLRDKMESVFYQLFKYANVYIYVMENGDIITLPVKKCRISNIMINGEPVVEFDMGSIKTDIEYTTNKAQKDFVEDDLLDERLAGYPKEIRDGIKSGKQWIQLNPKNTFVFQDLKEDWQRYAIPMIASCLTGLIQKEKITAYEGSLLDLGIRSFLHVTYGDSTKGIDYEPDNAQLSNVNGLFAEAMHGSALVTTNDMASAKFIQPDTNDLFEFDKYTEVNSEILSGGGISGIIVSGRSDDGSTFASAQVSMQTAALRIKRARDNFCEMMNQINLRLNGTVLPYSAPDKIPVFTMPPVDLSGDKRLQEACLGLWKAGCLSQKTLLTTYGYDLVQETDRRRKEDADGIKNPQVDTGEKSTEDNGDGTGTNGRPHVDDADRTSDISKARSGAQPKPSNPDGSESNE